MSQELKEEGNKLFQRRDHEGAMLNFRGCAKYSKALLKRARCYEALNRLDLAFRDVNNVLSMEPNNMTGLEILESVKKAMSEKGISFDEKLIGLDNVDETGVARLRKVVKEKLKKKKKISGEEKNVAGKVEEKKVAYKDKVFVLEKKVVPVVKDKEVHEDAEKTSDVVENGNVGESVEVEKGSNRIDDWIVQFARCLRTMLGLILIHTWINGMKLYSEAMEDTVTSEDARNFDIAADKFQEMAALALFNWGNVHMSRARKQIFFSEDGSRETVLAQKEYMTAGTRYQEALRIKPDFYEGLLAFGQQQFEQAKLCWCMQSGARLIWKAGF
uniref:Uncharacterized protein n=1 Tax=Salix viminalis TaxID=40686 RepID=A0A6N2NB48_SALVM